MRREIQEKNEEGEMRGEEERKYRRENECKCGKRRRREKKKVKDGG